MRHPQAPPSARSEGSFRVRLAALLAVGLIASGLIASGLIAAGCTSASGGLTPAPSVGAATTAPQTVFPASAAPFPASAAAVAATPGATAAPSVPAATPGATSAPPTPVPSATPPPAAATPVPSAAAVSYPLTLVDDEQNTVVIKAEPMRIVSITPATTEILFALGIGDRLIANTDADDYPPQVKSLPHVATYNSVDVEKIVSLDPDVVIAGGNNFNKPDALAQLRRLGIPVLVVYGPDVEGVLRDIALVAEAVGRPGRGSALVADLRSQFQDVRDATASLPHPRTFYELDATKEIYGPADTSFIAEMIALAGGTPITTGSTTVFSIPLEKLIAADPEVIVLGDSAYGTTPEIAAARPGWSTMAAVRAKAIRPIDDTIVTRPGPRLAEGLRALALAIHPGLVLPPTPSAGAGTTPSSTPAASAAPAGSASAAPARSASAAPAGSASAAPSPSGY